MNDAANNGVSKDSAIFVAGHRGLVGSAILRHLEADGYSNLITRDRDALDLTSQQSVADFFAEARPEYVFLAAAKVGGIYANDTYPADFIRDNLFIQTNVIDAAYRSGVTKLAFLGSSCVYPRMSPQPITEDCLLTGLPEPTNEWYAIAKIAGIKMCQAYAKQYGFNAISLMPTNLYGPGDNFSLKGGHVLPALIRRFHEAKEAGADHVAVWGTGTPKREFLHVDDLADAAIHLMLNYDEPDTINVGTGSDITIRELAETISAVVGFHGEIRFDPEKPDGVPRKVLDTGRIAATGWAPQIPLRDGITGVYAWYMANIDHLRT